MKKVLFMIILCVLFSYSPPVSRNEATISINNDKYDFLTIPYNREAIYSFEFTNLGKTPLIINDVKTSCGCTVPEWPKKPIKPGGKGEIKIKYDAAFPGVFHKTVEVFYNGPGSPFCLEIRGEVEYPEDRQL